MKTVDKVIVVFFTVLFIACNVFSTMYAMNQNIVRFFTFIEWIAVIILIGTIILVICDKYEKNMDLEE